MRVLVLGANGMLGHKLVQGLNRSFDVYACVRSFRDEFEATGICQAGHLLPEIDALDYEALKNAIVGLEPDVVINAIGIIKHREDAKNEVLSIETNSLLPHKLAEFTRSIGARLISFSTDCVFKGDRGGYTETDTADAEDIYGRSKALGEVSGKNCLTLRTSIIGRELAGSKSLLEWCLSKRGETISGFANAVYTGFTTCKMSDIVTMLITDFQSLEGLYHVSSDPINKYDLLNMVNREYDLGITIDKDEEFRIDRSLCSGRFRAETGYSPPGWEEMICEMANDNSPYNEWRKLRS